MCSLAFGLTLESIKFELLTVQSVPQLINVDKTERLEFGNITRK